MVTTWLHGVKVRAFLSTPVCRATLLTRNGGIRLQICRRTSNLCTRWDGFVCFFICSLWSSFKHIPTLSLYALWDAPDLKSQNLKFGISWLAAGASAIHLLSPIFYLLL